MLIENFLTEKHLGTVLKEIFPNQEIFYQFKPNLGVIRRIDYAVLFKKKKMFLLFIVKFI